MSLPTDFNNSRSNLAKHSRRNTLRRSIDMSAPFFQSRDNLAGGSRRNLSSPVNPSASLPDLRKQRRVSANDAEKYSADLEMLAEDDAAVTHERAKTIERENPISLVDFLQAGPQIHPRRASGDDGKLADSTRTLITQGLALSISGDIPTMTKVPEMAPLLGVLTCACANGTTFPVRLSLERYRITIEEVIEHIESSTDSTPTSSSLLKSSAERCLCVPDPLLESQFHFNLIHRGGILKLIAKDNDEMMLWMATINTASANVSLAHSLREGAQSGLRDTHREVYQRESISLLSELTAVAKSSDQLLKTPFGIGPTSNVELPWSLLRNPSTGTIEYEAEIGDDHTSWRTITSVSLDKLVERLCSSQDRDFIECVLLTYRHVTDAATLLDKLTSRLHVQPSEGASLQEIDAIRKWRPIVRIRAITVLKRWIDNYWDLDFGSASARAALERLVATLEGIDESPDITVSHASAQIPRLIARHLRFYFHVKESPKTQAYSKTTTYPVSKLSERIEFRDVDPKDLAVALTIIEASLLAAIKPIELLSHFWSDHADASRHGNTSNLNAMIEHFNSVSYWAATEVCTQPEVQSRARIIEKLIKLAGKCYKQNNYNTVLALVSGLNSSTVTRLKQSWEAVESKRRKQLEDLESLVTPEHNYRIYRRTLEASMPNCIPILSIYLKDILFMNDGNPKLVNGMINFSKLRMIYASVTGLCRAGTRMQMKYEKAQSESRTVPESVMSFARNLRALKEPALIKYSNLCENKEGKTIVQKWLEQGS
ncbi:ras guanine nucleotide exchange factor domain-containing protein [Cladochytrium replicatum]|nr:ras guanine nucleotide exchange factor domain-containing protein [Cladochytrium replicatum]